MKHPHFARLLQKIYTAAPTKFSLYLGLQHHRVSNKNVETSVKHKKCNLIRVPEMPKQELLPQTQVPLHEVLMQFASVQMEDLIRAGRSWVDPAVAKCDAHEKKWKVENMNPCVFCAWGDVSEQVLFAGSGFLKLSQGAI